MTSPTSLHGPRTPAPTGAAAQAAGQQQPPPADSRRAEDLQAPAGLQPRSPRAPGRLHHSQSARFHQPRPAEAPGAHPMWASARFTGGGSSPLLPPAALGRSDGSAPEAPAAAGRHEVVIDIDPPAHPPSLREQITDKLAKLDFAAPPGPLREAQLALEHEYIGWAAGVAATRESLFGARGYRIGQPQGKDFGAAVLPAAYDFARQFASSSSRSPVRNAVATHFAPHYTQLHGQRVNVGEFSNGWDASLVGGAAGGATAHLVDSTLLTAMDRQARQANLPQLKPVDLKALVPDPAPVQLSIVDGRKVYWRPGANETADIETGQASAAGRPTLAQLQEDTRVRRQALGAVQDLLEARNWGLFAQPLVTGAFNVLRRLAMPAPALLQPGPVFIGSVLASGTAGAVTKLGLGLLKPAAQARVDDLVGGTQQVSLFATRLPDPSQAPARWADIGQLPARAASTMRETAALGAHFVAGPWRDSGAWVPSRDASLARIGDVMRAVTANTLASVLSTATGPLVASVLREGLNVPAAHEATDSPAYLLQQAATSATNDYVWQASKEAHKNSAFDLAGSLDRWRAGRQERHRD